MLTATTFMAQYPEFGSIDPSGDVAGAIVLSVLTQADAMISSTAFRTLRDMAIGLWTAHRLAIRYKITAATINNPRVPGVLTTQSAQGSAVSFTVTASAAVAGEVAWRADFARTNYGLEYLSLLDTCIAPGRMAGVES